MTKARGTALGVFAILSWSCYSVADRRQQRNAALFVDAIIFSSPPRRCWPAACSWGALPRSPDHPSADAGAGFRGACSAATVFLCWRWRWAAIRSPSISLARLPASWYFSSLSSRRARHLARWPRHGLRPCRSGGSVSKAPAYRLNCRCCWRFRGVELGDYSALRTPFPRSAGCHDRFCRTQRRRLLDHHSRFRDGNRTRASKSAARLAGIRRWGLPILPGISCARHGDPVLLRA